ncbi:sulfatase-like hydrolase/transferase, partial [Lachnospiraceae bacterium OttesenSCG-928-E19]|nr:sulfatase-like hydrolase/transferase [Lachnospiraceae bacterium OttesenSCG-928-E19]
MKKFQFKKKINRIKTLKWNDVKVYRRAKKARRERILRNRQNSRFHQKMESVYEVMNRMSIVLQAVWSCCINFIIEAISRHSVVEAWNYMTGSPWVFLYNAYMIFLTFLLVYLVKRRVFVRIIISVLWLTLGVVNGYMLLKRVTPFNAQDLKAAGEGLSLFTKYFSPIELIMLVIGIVAVVMWVISMWRRGGQYTGKIKRVWNLVGIAAGFILYVVLTQKAIENRVVSTYFGNIAFAYQDYGLPYCFSTSLFNTGISQPNGYNEENLEAIKEEGNLTESVDESETSPNIIFIQLESFFDTSEVEALQTSEDPLPNFRKMAEEYSSGYFKVPSVGAGTANTEFEVLTGMNLRYFGPGEYPYKTILKEEVCESMASALGSLSYGTHALHNNGGNFYSRAKVFNNMGFDSYTSKEFMNILQLTENGWA